MRRALLALWAGLVSACAASPVLPTQEPPVSVTGLWRGAWAVTSCEDLRAPSTVCATFPTRAAFDLTLEDTPSGLGGSVRIADLPVPVFGATDGAGGIRLGGTARVNGVLVEIRGWQTQVSDRTMTGDSVVIVYGAGTTALLRGTLQDVTQ